MKRIVPIILALVLIQCANMPLLAGNPAGNGGSTRIVFSLNWGYDATILDIYHFNYIHPNDGYRVDEQKVKPMLYSNGNAAAGISVEFARHFSLGIYGGYAGVQQRTRLFPLSLKAAYYFNSYAVDGTFITLEGGAGFHEKRDDISPFSKVGYGWRMKLGKKSSMDLGLNLRITADHPPVYDASIYGYVPEENMRRSDAVYSSVGIGIGLNF